ncbi:MAG: FAD-dependent oxidoreductase, partial [bacterium]
MKRNLRKLKELHFDVLIIGGGIHGAAIALEAARAGFKTALIERRDFCQATSANSLKILHGGLRYLQKLDFARMRASICSRHEFMRQVPHLIIPLAFVIPTYGYGFRNKTLLRTALLINDLIGWKRNAYPDAEMKLPRGKILSRQKFCQIVPDTREDQISGAALWYDALVLNTERLTLELIKKACEYEACVANYVEGTKILIQNNRAYGVEARDNFSGKSIKIIANLIVNATGPWIEQLLELPAMTDHNSAWTRGLNIIVRRKFFTGHAVGFEGDDGNYDVSGSRGSGKRFYFFVPWRGYTMIGTSYKKYIGDPDQFKIDRKEIEDFVRDINRIYPRSELRFKEVTNYHAGLLPMDERRTKNHEEFNLENNSRIIDHSKRHNIRGLYSVKGV